MFILGFTFYFPVTQSPEIIAESSIAKVSVPTEAANSQVGFEHSVVTVNESEFYCCGNSSHKNSGIASTFLRI